MLAAIALISGANPTSFRFLAGHKPSPAYTVPDNLGRSGPYRAVDFEFEGDGSAVIAAADAELLPLGWRRWTDEDNFLAGAEGLAMPCVSYREPKGLQRTVFIEPNADPPERMMTSDIVVTGTYRRGWVGVVVDWPVSRRGRSGDWRVLSHR